MKPTDPAFARPSTVSAVTNEVLDWSEPGISVRLYLAAHAPECALDLAGTIKTLADELGITEDEYRANPNGTWCRAVAKRALAWADALLAEASAPATALPPAVPSPAEP